MGRILGIDYGKRRTGLSVTDPLQLIVSGLDTIETEKLQDFIKTYCQNNEVEKIVIGLPTHKDGNYTYLKKDIDQFVAFLKKQLPSILIDFQDETNTSIDAMQIMIQSGVKKSKRRDKKLVDKISAVLILQKYLNHI